MLRYVKRWVPVAVLLSLPAAAWAAEKAVEACCCCPLGCS